MRLRYLLLIAVALFIQLPAQGSNVIVIDDPKIPIGEQTVLYPYIYEVTSPGGMKSYLFGSFHQGIGVEQLPHWIRRLHQNAEIHGYEMIVTNFNDFHSMQRLKMDPARALRDLGVEATSSEMSEEEIQKLISFGIPDVVARALQDSSCEALIFRSHFFGQVYSSLDDELMLYSMKFNRPILELEDDELRERARRLEPPDDGQACSVKNILKYLSEEQVDKIVNDMESKYLAGQEKTDEDYDDKEDAGLFYRNQAWVEKLIAPLQTRRAFITFGFNHLFGRLGVIRLLEEKGFKVRRLFADPGDAPGANHRFQR